MPRLRNFDGTMPADGPPMALRALSSCGNRLDPKKIDLNATYANDFFARKADALTK